MRRAALYLALAALFFGLGVFFARRDPSPSPSTPPLASSHPDVAILDAGGPRIMFDPSSIELLPDASLRLDPMAPPDAGAR